MGSDVSGPVPPLTLRTGVGVDAHRLVEGRPMSMAGLSFPDETVGPEGHSDGDVACHALCDALLSAAGLGDVGEVFGTDDPLWQGAAGVVLLSHTAALVAEHGWRIANASVEIMGNRPRMSQRRREAEAVLSSAIQAPVSVAATSTDGLGFTGRGEGIMAVASALLIGAN